jgi:hypothetical protein
VISGKRGDRIAGLFAAVPVFGRRLRLGVSVTVNGKPAYVYFINQNQINVPTPLDSALGSVGVQVINATGTSNVFTATVLENSLGFFAFNSAKPTASVTSKTTDSESPTAPLDVMVGLRELESLTSCVSSRRSNQLSYRPGRG